jgi:hypothetical protein
MNSLYPYDRIVALHHEQLLRDAEQRRLVVIAEAITKSSNVSSRIRHYFGRLLVTWGLKLQSLSGELPRIEYIAAPACGEQSASRLH